MYRNWSSDLVIIYLRIAPYSDVKKIVLLPVNVFIHIWFCVQSHGEKKFVETNILVVWNKYHFWPHVTTHCLIQFSFPTVSIFLASTIHKIKTTTININGLVGIKQSLQFCITRKNKSNPSVKRLSFGSKVFSNRTRLRSDKNWVRCDSNECRYNLMTLSRLGV